ncbi:Inner membrane transport protein YnfM [Corynebacterium provencense]|uniref:Inner membrane transport protein YnfM n=2 Tax=Corynebacterium provencense TaxID=1737425 RepID=A0A2Z3YU84_9CORY|nr:Inner membrane transport protein YnfM [Corynebacterium provencense]
MGTMTPPGNAPATPPGAGTTARRTTGLAPGDPGYRRVMIAAATAGLASFNAMYLTQALLPSISDSLRVSPTTAALTVSATTGLLAVTVVPVSIISERIGRRTVLRASVLAATVLSLLLCLAPGISSLIGLRALQGIAVAGVPAVTMTFLAEEIRPSHLGRVMGLYIAGTSIGGLMGRLIPSWFLEITDWRGAALAGASVAFLLGLVCAWALPPQRNFTPKKITLRHEVSAFRRHWHNPRLVPLFLLPFMLMGSFVSLYNYLGFQLTRQFGLSEIWAGMVFLLYLSGTWSSARAGALSARYGPGKVLTASSAISVAGLLVMLVPALWTTVLGALMFTASFFAAHSTASALVGARADGDRAEASSTYVMSYYLGSSILGWALGHVFDLGWTPLVISLAGVQLVSLALTLYADRREGRRERRQGGRRGERRRGQKATSSAAGH